MGLSGEQPLGEAKTKAPNSKDEPPVAVFTPVRGGRTGMSTSGASFLGSV